MEQKKQRKNNTLKSERHLTKHLGFEATRPDSLAKNPYLNLTNNKTVVQMAGLLFSIVTTSTHFGTGQYLKRWKSSNGNDPYATMTTTQLNADGIGRHTEIYTREIFKEQIPVLARRYGCKEEDVVVDHVNHIRGDNYDENLRLATTAQNNQNRSKIKITKAFYTLEEVIDKLTSGEWQVLSKKRSSNKGYGFDLDFDGFEDDFGYNKYLTEKGK